MGGLSFINMTKEQRDHFPSVVAQLGFNLPKYLAKCDLAHHTCKGKGNKINIEGELHVGFYWP